MHGTGSGAIEVRQGGREDVCQGFCFHTGRDRRRPWHAMRANNRAVEFERSGELGSFDGQMALSTPRPATAAVRPVMDKTIQQTSGVSDDGVAPFTVCPAHPSAAPIRRGSLSRG